MTSIQFGEKGHKEFCWSTYLREKILQFNYQINRTNMDGIEKLEKILRSILDELSLNINIEIPERDEMLIILYKMIGQTRDIIDGKGEYFITYMMLKVWYEFYPTAAEYALKLIVEGHDDNSHPYGSWKDIKYFCYYLHKISKWEENHPFILYSCSLINTQLKKDMMCNDKSISLAAKWIPREKSNKFGWLYYILAYEYFDSYLKTAKTENSLFNAKCKAKMEYRKLLSSLNKHIDTVQIKQCAKLWSEIDHSKNTSITIIKQKNAFLNVNKNGDTKYENIVDREVCSNNFKNYINDCIEKNMDIKGKRISLPCFTKNALELLKNKNKPNYEFEKNLLNSQWRDNSSQIPDSLGTMVAMIDTSCSMVGEPLNCAIALGCKIAEKSILGKRILTFDSSPKWTNMEDCDNFVDMVEKIEKSNWGLNANFYSALDAILAAIIDIKMSPECVENMVLSIFSDMQIDVYEYNYQNSTLYENIEKIYAETGMKLFGKPYKPPHILFWNLRSTNGFPTLYTQKGTSMMSGFNPSFLNLFCEKGAHSLLSYTPWNFLIQSINNERYKKLEIFMKEQLDILQYKNI